MLSPDKVKAILIPTKRGYRNSPNKFAEYFQEAYQLLSKGWCQGAYARSRKGYRLESGRSKHAATFCAMGALERTTPEHKEFRVAKMLLGAALGTGDRWSIASINDGPDKAVAKQQIMDGYRDVISALAAL